MLIEKDYVLIFFILMFLFILFNYLKLYSEKKRQLEFFIKTLGHEFNVSVLAQIRALELVNQYNTSEMIENIKENLYKGIIDENAIYVLREEDVTSELIEAFTRLDAKEYYFDGHVLFTE